MGCSAEHWGSASESPSEEVKGIPVLVFWYSHSHTHSCLVTSYLSASPSEQVGEAEDKI